jgi:hypothetical protein
VDAGAPRCRALLAAKAGGASDVDGKSFDASSPAGALIGRRCYLVDQQASRREYERATKDRLPTKKNLEDAVKQAHKYVQWGTPFRIVGYNTSTRRHSLSYFPEWDTSTLLPGESADPFDDSWIDVVDLERTPCLACSDIVWARYQPDKADSVW